MHRAAPSSVRLDEITFKDMIGDIVPNNAAGATTAKLPYRDWAPLVPLVRYTGCRKGTLRFFVPNRYNGWETFIQFADWNAQVADRSLKANEAARLLLWAGNIRIHCGCPAFLFYGFEYILTQLDAAIVPETRFPKIRNPQLKGVACKHLIRTLKVLPFHLGDMAKAVAADRRRTGPPPPLPTRDGPERR